MARAGSAKALAFDALAQRYELFCSLIFIAPNPLVLSDVTKPGDFLLSASTLFLIERLNSSAYNVLL